MLRRFIAFVSCFGLGSLLYGQTNPDYEFLFHLTQEHHNREALFLLNSGQGMAQADSANYLRGLNYYYLKQPDSAAVFFTAVSDAVPLHTPAMFFAALNFAYARQPGQTVATLNRLPADTQQVYSGLINLMRAGNFLLVRDFAGFDSLSTTFLYDDYRYVNEQRRLVTVRDRLLRQKKKSPALAGLLSAVVPGLGKFYAGKKGAALAAFATTAVLGLVTAEAWYRGGPGFNNVPFITGATLFSFFYAGNIAGSVYSVKQQTRSMNGKANNEILADIHVALVRTFK